MRRFLVVSMVILGLGALPKAADAGYVTGELDLAGGVVVNALGVQWFQTVNPNVGPGVAVIISNQLHEGATANPLIDPLIPIPAFSLINETNLSAATPAGVPLNVNFFEQPQAASNIDFVLTYISTCPQLGGSYTCFGASPFGFIQNSNSVTIALQMFGNVFDTATPGLVTQWTGSWSTQIAGATIAGLFATIEAGGSISNSYSGTKIAALAVPEPATLLTFGAAMAFLVAHRRRQAKNRA